MKTVLNLSLEFEQMLLLFGYGDKRIKKVCVILMNINKKSFFNTYSVVILRLVEGMLERGGTRSMFTDFYKSLKSFLDVFDMFRDFSGFESVVSEFVRRSHHFFLYHFEKLFTHPRAVIDMEDLLDLMDELFLARKMNTDLVKQLAQKYSKFDQKWTKVLCGFGRKFILLAGKAIEKFRIRIETQFNIEFAKRTIDQDDFFELARKRASKTIERISRLNKFYQSKLRGAILAAVIKEFLRTVLSSDQEHIKAHINRALDDMHAFLQNFPQDFMLKSREKFLVRLKGFFRTARESSMDTYLGELITLSGIRLSNDAVYALINCKDYKERPFSARQTIDRWKPMLEKEEKVNKRRKDKETRSINVDKIWRIFIILIKFKSIVRRIVKRQKKFDVTNSFSFQDESHRGKKEIIKGNQPKMMIMTLENHFVKLKHTNFRFFCFRREEASLRKFGIHDPKRELRHFIEHVLPEYYIWVFPVFERNRLNFYCKERQQMIKTLLPAKISTCGVISAGRRHAVCILYDDLTFLIFMGTSEDQILKLNTAFQSLIKTVSNVGIFREGAAIHDVGNIESNSKRTLILNELYSNSIYQFKFPKIRSELVAEVKEKEKQKSKVKGKKKGSWNMNVILKGFGIGKKDPFVENIGREIFVEEPEPWTYDFGDYLTALGFRHPDKKYVTIDNSPVKDFLLIALKSH